LPEVVRRLRERTPALALTLKELVSTAQVEALDAGQLDMALMRPLALHGELVSLPIATEDLLLAIPANEADSWPEAPTLACLHRRPFVMYSPHEARPFYQMLTARFEREAVAPDVVEHIGQVHTMLALVSAGIGAALVSEACARLQFDGVVLRKMKTEPVSTVCTYRRDNENPILQLFIKEILPAFPGAR
jgi:DNA-binding transcriptional LysR family regulator